MPLISWSLKLLPCSVHPRNSNVVVIFAQLQLHGPLSLGIYCSVLETEKKIHQFTAQRFSLDGRDQLDNPRITISRQPRLQAIQSGATDRLAHLVTHRNTTHARDRPFLKLRPDQHSGSINNREENAGNVITAKWQDFPTHYFIRVGYAIPRVVVWSD